MIIFFKYRMPQKNSAQMNHCVVSLSTHKSVKLSQDSVLLASDFRRFTYCNCGNYQIYMSYTSQCDNCGICKILFQNNLQTYLPNQTLIGTLLLFWHGAVQFAHQICLQLDERFGQIVTLGEEFTPLCYISTQQSRFFFVLQHSLWEYVIIFLIHIYAFTDMHANCLQVIF